MRTLAAAIGSAAALASWFTVIGQAVPDGRALFLRSWTVEEGLGPNFNATSCVACHPEAITPTAAAEAESFVWFARGFRDPTGGAIFRRFTFQSNGAVAANVPPRTATRRRPPRLSGVGLFERLRISDMPSTGRFGWKARYPSLADVVAAALSAEIGLTTWRFPEDGRTVGARPEVSRVELAALVDFVRGLRPPVPADLSSPGARLFTNIGCAQCHRPNVAHVSGEVIAVPFTDLRLHDLGPALADGIDEGPATGRQFRTPPLWGLRYVTHGYLHDGRAVSIEAAIAAHGGEADPARSQYQTLSTSEKTLLQAFLQGR